MSIDNRSRMSRPRLCIHHSPACCSIRFIKAKPVNALLIVLMLLYPVVASANPLPSFFISPFCAWKSGTVEVYCSDSAKVEPTNLNA